MFSRMLSVAAVALLGFGLMSSTPVLADNTAPQSVDITTAPPADNTVTVPATPDTPDSSTTDAAPSGDGAADKDDDEGGGDTKSEAAPEAAPE